MNKQQKKGLMIVGLIGVVTIILFLVASQSFVAVDIPQNRVQVKSFNVTFWDSKDSYVPSFGIVSESKIALSAYNWYTDGKYNTASTPGQQHILSVEPVDADDILLTVSASTNSIRGVTDNYIGSSAVSIALVGNSGGQVDSQSILWLYNYCERPNGIAQPGTCIKEFNGNLRAHNNKDGTWDIFQKECQSCPDTYIRTINAPSESNLAMVVYGSGGPYRSNGASGSGSLQVSKLELKKTVIDPLVEDLLNRNDFLSASIEEKARIIRALETTLDNQVYLVKSLQLNIDDNAKLIKALQLKSDEQAIMISELYNKTEEQAEIISKLTDNIQEQALIIDSLRENLKNKVELVQKLQATTDEQYALIAQMKLSFTQQQDVVNQLQSTVENDAKLISSFKLSLEQEAVMVANLKKTNEEKEAIIKKLTDNINEQKIIIDEMKKNLEEREQIIKDLEKNLEIERKLSEELANQLKSQTKTSIDKNTFLMIGGGVFLALVVIASYIFLRKGKKGRK